MIQIEKEAEKYAQECRKHEGIHPTYDSYDAQEMRECGYIRGYKDALANQWINTKYELPPNGAHCFIKKKEQNSSQQWQWDYSIAEYIAPEVKNQKPVFRVYDMVVRLSEVSHFMIIPEL